VHDVPGITGDRSAVAAGVPCASVSRSWEPSGFERLVMELGAVCVSDRFRSRLERAASDGDVGCSPPQAARLVVRVRPRKTCFLGRFEIAARRSTNAGSDLGTGTMREVFGPSASASVSGAEWVGG